MKTSIYETITNQIVAAIEEGAGLYKMPWHRSRSDITSPQNLVSGNSYRGLNILTLWMAAEARGYDSGTWATYRQWLEKGAQVRKGEKSTSVFFWKKLDSVDDQQADNASNDRRGGFTVAKSYNVFNAAQVEGYTPPAIPALSEDERVGAADRFFGQVPAKVEFGGGSACYVPNFDTVRMPPFAQFTSAKAFYSVFAHELTHWTGASARLDRELSTRFGSESYAMEELVAELGAAFIAGRLALPSEPRTDHAPYIASWLKVLKNDSRAIFTAAAKAQAAADYLASFSQDVSEEEEAA